VFGFWSEAVGFVPWMAVMAFFILRGYGDPADS
jgi:hypothetical protein